MKGVYYINVYCYSYSTSTDNSYQLLIYPNDSLPDAYEANDSKETAKSILQGEDINATININTDEGWYYINAATSGKLTVMLDSIPVNCDYDIAIYDESKTYVASSTLSGNESEKASVLINEPGYYYIRVYSWIGSDPSDNYGLKAVVSQPDKYEVNDYYYNYKEVLLGDKVSATIDNLKDEDWFRINISETGDYIFALQNIPIGADYDLYMYDLSRNYVGSSTQGAGKGEFINTTLNSGDYYIKIVPFTGYSDSDEYTFSFNKPKTFSMEFDKMYANVGEIVTAEIKANNISNIAGFQVNVKYDPAVLQAVDPNTGDPYTSNTVPTEGNILVNTQYEGLYLASHDLDNGVLNFGKAYQDIDNYRIDGNAESTGTVAKVGFKVLGDYATNVRLEEFVYENEGEEDSVIEDAAVFNWYGDKVSDIEYLIIQPNTINPYSPVMINSSSIMEFSNLEASSESITPMVTAGSTKITVVLVEITRVDIQERIFKSIAIIY